MDGSVWAQVRNRLNCRLLGRPRNEAFRCESVDVVDMLIGNPALERHYRISALAEIWGLGRETVRRLVKDDPGVIKIRMGRKKCHTLYSIPESAVRRIHTRLLNVA